MDRSVLSPKGTNAPSLPLKLPSRLPSKSPSKSPTKSTRPFPLLPLRPRKQARTQAPPLNFTIYEDPVKPPVLDAIDDDQENVLQPIRKMLRKGTPLSNLCIKQFAGYLHVPGFDGRMALVPLRELFQPVLFDNEFGNAHKKTNIPNYTTPPRLKRDKYLVLSRGEPVLPTRRRSSSVGRNAGRRRLVRKNAFSVRA